MLARRFLAVFTRRFLAVFTRRFLAGLYLIQAGREPFKAR